MPIAAVITAPTRPLPATRGSPLNPFNLPRAPSSHSLKTPTHTHLSNLDRLLKPSPNLTQPNSLPLTSTTKIRYTSPTSDGGGLFSALNLPSLFPSLANPKSEMSPRSLTKLQRLLSNTQRLSPKNSIASRWHLFHGSTNWAGLIHPHLDDNLRRELVRYGDLVQAAYHAFHSNPTASASRHRPLVLPDRFYRSTKSLFASSSIDLPNWVDGLAPWMTQRSSWIGYVAVCDNDREIQRMGRRDIVIALRGTATCLEWAENFRAGLTSIDSATDAKAASGFHSLHKTPGPHVPSLSAAVVEEIRRLIDLYKGEELSISITGHSLGGALALLVADELSTCIPDVPPIAVYSFGGPKVGNRAFADRLEKNGVKVLRVVNPNDVVTRVPGVELGKGLGEKWGSHVGTDGYVHVGKELSVDSKVSPYLRPNADPACCHDLESYLHLVDGFTGTGCPFRSEAKRSLVRLMSQQRPNVKRLYVNRAKSLALDRFEPAVAMASPTTVSGCLVSPST